MITKQEAEKAIKEYGSQVAAADAIGVSRSALRRALEKGSLKPPTANYTTKGRSIDEFKQTYDKDTIVPSKIDAALELLGDGWEYEVNFAKLAGVSLADIGTYREMYADYYVQVRRDGKRAWAGTKATARHMREMLS